MAFATSNVARDNAGSTSIMRGNWTGTVGDAAGAVTGRGFALSAEFLDNNSTGPGQTIPVRISNSGGTWTVTVPYEATCTAGTFRIEFK